MRIFLPVILAIISLVVIGYLFFVKKEKKLAREVCVMTAFFCGIWSLIYTFLLT